MAVVGAATIQTDESDGAGDEVGDDYHHQKFQEAMVEHRDSKLFQVQKGVTPVNFRDPNQFKTVDEQEKEIQGLMDNLDPSGAYLSPEFVNNIKSASFVSAPNDHAVVNNESEWRFHQWNTFGPGASLPQNTTSEQYNKILSDRVISKLNQNYGIRSLHPNAG